jgi:hypothetical protein
MMQGGVFSPWGDLYLIAGRSDDCPRDVNGGIHLFRRSAFNQPFTLIESSSQKYSESDLSFYTSSGPVLTPAGYMVDKCDMEDVLTETSDFTYNYLPTDLVYIIGYGEVPGSGEEPEGIDW